MKIALCTAIALCSTALPLMAEPDTAYAALRTVGTERGADALKHVIEVVGRGGVPQPAVWRVVLDDPGARGGVRELDVSHGKIVAEHTPVRAYSGSSAGALIDFAKLNLDSSGAFTVAEKEAEKAHVGFDAVDYTLRTSDSADANPVWVIHMMDASRHSVGTLSLAADTGVIGTSDFSGKEVPEPVAGGGAPPPPGPAPVAPVEPVPPVEPTAPVPVTPVAPADSPLPDYTSQDPDHDNLYNPAAEPSPVRQADPSDTEDTQGLRVGHRIKQAFLSAGESLKNFVTGNSGQ